MSIREVHQTMLYFGEVYENRGGVGYIHIFAGSQRVVSINTSNNTEQYYHPNHLGSASVMTDINGNLTEAIEYYPYGTYRGSNQNPTAHYTFTGQEDDHELGLYNFKARLYDPLLGRFTTPDSIVPQPGNPQSLNRYSYCLNNPLIYIDPSGHFSLGDIGDFFEDVGRGIGDFFSDYGPDILAGAVGAAVFIASGGTAAPIFAGIMGGMAAGATNAALNGAPLSGILQAAAMGGAFGALGGGLYAAHVPVWAMVGGGAAVATATGGLEGLAHYTAGLAGATVGGAATQAYYDASKPVMLADTRAPESIKIPSWASRYWQAFQKQLTGWTKQQAEILREGKQGYADWNVQVPILRGAGFTGGPIVAVDGSLYGQLCVGYVPSFGVSITGSTSAVGTGFLFAAQGSYAGAAGQYGWAFNGGWFYEAGSAYPAAAGWSVTGCYIFGPILP